MLFFLTPNDPFRRSVQDRATPSTSRPPRRPLVPDGNEQSTTRPPPFSAFGQHSSASGFPNAPSIPFGQSAHGFASASLFPSANTPNSNSTNNFSSMPTSAFGASFPDPAPPTQAFPHANHNPFGSSRPFPAPVEPSQQDLPLTQPNASPFSSSVTPFGFPSANPSPFEAPATSTTPSFPQQSSNPAPFSQFSSGAAQSPFQNESRPFPPAAHFPDAFHSDPFQTQTAQQQQPQNPQSQFPFTTGAPTSDPFSANPFNSPAQQPTNDPFAPGSSNPTDSQPTNDPFADSHNNYLASSQPANDPFAQPQNPHPISSQPLSDPFSAPRKPPPATSDHPQDPFSANHSRSQHAPDPFAPVESAPHSSSTHRRDQLFLRTVPLGLFEKDALIAHFASAFPPHRVQNVSLRGLRDGPAYRRTAVITFENNAEAEAALKSAPPFHGELLNLSHFRTLAERTAVRDEPPPSNELVFTSIPSSLFSESAVRNLFNSICTNSVVSVSIKSRKASNGMLRRTAIVKMADIESATTALRNLPSFEGERLRVSYRQRPQQHQEWTQIPSRNTHQMTEADEATMQTASPAGDFNLDLDHGQSSAMRDDDEIQPLEEVPSFRTAARQPPTVVQHRDLSKDHEQAQASRQQEIEDLRRRIKEKEREKEHERRRRMEKEKRKQGARKLATETVTELKNRPSKDGDGWRKGEKVDIDDAVSLVGICQTMCPADEIEDRVLQKDIAEFEKTNGKVDKAKAVKKYRRSAAISEAPRPIDLRPGPVLLKTMEHLKTVADLEADFPAIHFFIRDRTRSIRQDFTVQGVMDDTCIKVHEECVRFHIYSQHRLFHLPMDRFSPQQNLEQLDNCLVSLRDMYKLRREKRLPTSPYEPEMQAYSLLLHIASPMKRAELLSSLASDVQRSEPIQFAVNVAKSVNLDFSGNAVNFFECVQQAPYLAACLLHPHFQRIRLNDITGLALAHDGSPGDYILVSELTNRLGFDDDTETINYFTFLGFKVETDGAEPLDDVSDSETHRLRIILQHPRKAQIHESVSKWKVQPSMVVVEGKAFGIKSSEIIGGEGGVTWLPHVAPAFTPSSLRLPKAIRNLRRVSESIRLRLGMKDSQLEASKSENYRTPPKVEICSQASGVAEAKVFSPEFSPPTSEWIADAEGEKQIGDATNASLEDTGSSEEVLDGDVPQVEPLSKSEGAVTEKDSAPEKENPSVANNLVNVEVVTEPNQEASGAKGLLTGTENEPMVSEPNSAVTSLFPNASIPFAWTPMQNAAPSNVALTTGKVSNDISAVVSAPLPQGAAVDPLRAVGTASNSEFPLSSPYPYAAISQLELKSHPEASTFGFVQTPSDGPSTFKPLIHPPQAESQKGVLSQKSSASPSVAKQPCSTEDKNDIASPLPTSTVVQAAPASESPVACSDADAKVTEREQLIAGGGDEETNFNDSRKEGLKRRREDVEVPVQRKAGKASSGDSAKKGGENYVRIPRNDLKDRVEEDKRKVLEFIVSMTKHFDIVDTFVQNCANDYNMTLEKYENEFNRSEAMLDYMKRVLELMDNAFARAYEADCARMFVGRSVAEMVKGVCVGQWRRAASLWDELTMILYRAEPYMRQVRLGIRQGEQNEMVDREVTNFLYNLRSMRTFVKPKVLVEALEKIGARSRIRESKREAGVILQDLADISCRVRERGLRCWHACMMHSPAREGRASRWVQERLCGWWSQASTLVKSVELMDGEIDRYVSVVNCGGDRKLGKWAHAVIACVDVVDGNVDANWIVRRLKELEEETRDLGMVLPTLTLVVALGKERRLGYMGNGKEKIEELKKEVVEAEVVSKVKVVYVSEESCEKSEFVAGFRNSLLESVDLAQAWDTEERRLLREEEVRKVLVRQGLRKLKKAMVGTRRFDEARGRMRRLVEAINEGWDEVLMDVYLQACRWPVEGSGRRRAELLVAQRAIQERVRLPTMEELEVESVEEYARALARKCGVREESWVLDKKEASELHPVWELCVTLERLLDEFVRTRCGEGVWDLWLLLTKETETVEEEASRREVERYYEELDRRVVGALRWEASERRLRRKLPEEERANRPAGEAKRRRTPSGGGEGDLEQMYQGLEAEMVAYGRLLEASEEEIRHRMDDALRGSA